MSHPLPIIARMNTSIHIRKPKTSTRKVRERAFAPPQTAPLS